MEVFRVDAGNRMDGPAAGICINLGKTPIYPICTMIGQIKVQLCFFIINFRVVFKAEHISFWNRSPVGIVTGLMDFRTAKRMCPAPY